MKTKNKLLTLLILSASATSVTAFINKCIKISATSKNHLDNNHSHCYHWRLGDIHYTKCGTGKPLLLIHDLHSSSSNYEWKEIIELLKDQYTIYAIDLLGCGKSEKPYLTYTNYLYVQLISEFIKSEIGHRTDVIVTGKSASLAVMACNYNADLFNNIMIINPESMSSTSQIPNKYAKLYKTFLDLPVIGTLIYNIANNKESIKKDFIQKYFYNPYSVKSCYIDTYYESAHMGYSPKSIFASDHCNYIKCNIVTAIKKINHSIYLVGGSHVENIEEILNEYLIYNSSIETAIIPQTKYLPQLESPNELSKTIKMFLS